MSQPVTEQEKRQIIDKAVKWAIDTANDNKHGYPTDIHNNIVGPNYKCTTFVYFAWYNAGVFKHDRNYIENHWDGEHGAGGGVLFHEYLKDHSDLFRDVTRKVNFNNCKTLEKGDILVHIKPEHMHTALYTGSCKMAEATGDYDHKSGDSSGKEILHHSYNNYSDWNYAYRYTPQITTKKSTEAVNKSKGEHVIIEKRSQGNKQKRYKPVNLKPLVRSNLGCTEDNLTDLEQNYCNFKPVQDGEAAVQAVIQNVLSTVYLWTGIISVIVIVIGGIKFMTSAGDSNKVQNAKNTIMYALIGLIITLGAFAITNFFLGALNGNIN